MLSMKWGPRKIALARQKCYSNKWVCEKCTRIFPKRQIEIHHHVPLAEANKEKDFKAWLGRYAELLFCSDIAVTILCKACHRGITATHRQASVVGT